MHEIRRKILSPWAIVALLVILITLFWMVTIASAGRNNESSPQGFAGKKDVSAHSASSWRVYENREFGFRMRYPDSWDVEERRGIGAPIITFYKTNSPEALAAPFDAVANATHVSVYPAGQPPRGAAMGRRRMSRAEIPGAIAIDYLLSDRMPYATEFSFSDAPESWNEDGILFARLRVEGIDLDCMRRGVLIPLGECRTEQGDEIIRKGEVEVDDRKVEEAMIRTFEFLRM